MPSATQRRKRAANRARTSLPRRRSSSGHALARRGIVILGIVVAASLVLALAVTFTSTTTGPPTPTTPSRTDPNQLIARATANPTDSNAVGDLADYYDKTGQYQSALLLYQRYLTLQPDDAQAHASVGTLLFISGDIAGARSQFLQALALTPTARAAAQAHLGLGKVYTVLQPPRLTDALNEYQQASALDPSGDIGNSARTHIAALQQQLSSGTATVVAPTGAPANGGAPPLSRPSGTP